MLNMIVHPRKNKHNNESGFASVAVALILVIILSLLTIAFAQLARREQKSSLDKQLAIQANYAAESGINDVVNILNKDASSLSNSPDRCLKSAQLSGAVAPARGVSYSCVLLNLKPKSLEKDLVVGKSWNQVFSTEGNGTGTLGLNISWYHAKADDTDTSTKAPRGINDTSFVPTSQWNSPAVIQLSITPLTDNFKRDYLANNTYTTFLYPSKTGSSSTTTNFNPSTNAQAAITSGGCSDDGICASKITGIPAPAGITKYLVHAVGYYDNAHVTITSTDPTVSFVNGQAVIDVTGKAQNVLKRLQVRVPIDGSNNTLLPNYALEGQSICKRLQTRSGNTEFYSPDDTKASADPTEKDPCYLSN